MTREVQKLEAAVRISRGMLDRMLAAHDVESQLEFLHKIGILGQLFPSVQALVGFGGGESGHKDLWDHTKRVVHQMAPDDVALRWACLFHDVGKPHSFTRHGGKVAFHGHEAVSARLFRRDAEQSKLFTAEEVERIGFIIENLGHVESYEFEWTDSAVRRLIALLGDRRDDVLAVGRADCTTGQQSMKNRHRRLTTDLERRVNEVLAADALPPALPTGLGEAVIAKLGFGNPMTRDEQQKMGQVWNALKAKVEAGELPRNADFSVYLEQLEKL